MSRPTTPMPALSLVATPKRRTTILDLAVEAERLGFSGIACPSLGATMGLCVSLAHVTRSIPFWTSIQPIYYSHPVETANTAAHIHEVSGGRFRLGIGVSHGPVTARLGVTTGRPLADVASHVAAMKGNERFGGELPPIYLAALRDRMLALAGTIADGAVWANASLSQMAPQLARVALPAGFHLSNMIPTVIDSDVAAAEAVNRRTLAGYVTLPNYRNYWRDAGYGDEMDAVEAALAAGDKDATIAAMSDSWLRDCSLAGPPAAVREGVERWTDAGIQPILVMSSTSGGQAKAVAELFEMYRRD